MSTVQADYTHVLQQVRTWPAELRRDLVGELIESLEADPSVAPGEWNEANNARRSALIDKEIDGTLTSAERVELEVLQKQAVAHRDHVAPLPLAAARRLHEELLVRKRHHDHGLGRP